MQWDDGQDTEHLDQLFHPEVEMQFLQYENGKPAPRLTGRAAARERAIEDEDATGETFYDVEYMDGSVAKTQRWMEDRAARRGDGRPADRGVEEAEAQPAAQEPQLALQDVPAAKPHATAKPRD